jgi:hypothetical protein
MIVEIVEQFKKANEKEANFVAPKAVSRIANSKNNNNKTKLCQLFTHLFY